MKIYSIIGGVDGTGKREDVRRRYTERFDSLLDVMPLCNEIFFYDNENGFVEVGRYRSGEMILRANAPA